MTPAKDAARSGKRDLRPLVVAFIGTLTGAAISTAVIVLAQPG